MFYYILLPGLFGSLHYLCTIAIILQHECSVVIIIIPQVLSHCQVCTCTSTFSTGRREESSHHFVRGGRERRLGVAAHEDVLCISRSRITWSYIIIIGTSLQTLPSQYSSCACIYIYQYTISVFHIVQPRADCSWCNSFL